jgi:hypothetical protein
MVTILRWVEEIKTLLANMTNTSTKIYKAKINVSLIFLPHTSARLGPSPTERVKCCGMCWYSF